MVFKAILISVFCLGMAAFVSGCCHCHNDGTHLENFPPELVQIIRPHFPKESKGESGAIVLHRPDFSGAELAQLDAFTKEYTGGPFETAIVSDCSCKTGDGEKGVWLTIPGAGTFCESCGVGIVK